MDWMKYFTDFVSGIPGGGAILGILGGAIVAAPFIPKILASIRKYKAEVAADKAAEAERKRRADEDRMQQMIEDREFRKRMTEVIEQLPEVSRRIEQLADATSVLHEAKERLEGASHGFADELAQLVEQAKRVGDEVKNLEKVSTAGDEKLGTAIAEVKTNVESVTEKVEMIVESDLDDFRNYLIEMHARHVHGKEPITKREIELLCMKFKKYVREGGNGWGERMYYEVLQCKTAEGVVAEEIAEKLHILIRKKSDEAEKKSKKKEDQD